MPRRIFRFTREHLFVYVCYLTEYDPILSPAFCYSSYCLDNIQVDCYDSFNNLNPEGGAMTKAVLQVYVVKSSNLFIHTLMPTSFFSVHRTY